MMMEKAGKRDDAAIGLGGLVILCACLAIAVGSAPLPQPARSAGATPVFAPNSAFVQEGSEITIRSSMGGDLWWSGQGDAFSPRKDGDAVAITVEPHRHGAMRTLAIPSAMQWRHPLPGLPAAMVLQAAEVDDLGRPGPWRMHTCVTADHGELPIVSVSVPHAALFSADSGIYVVGNGILGADPAVLRSYAIDPRWWKYPGNYHGRGKRWEREARMQLIDEQGSEVFQTPVALRINGQMTRGFPQHALRMIFPAPLRVQLFSDGDGIGTTSLILRAAGNDQVKAMIRDAYQHELCAGLPFEVSRARPCVVYINGAYWGVHHLRQRMDDEELARRYSITARHITILEDQAELYRGDSGAVRDFLQLVHRTEKWDARDPNWIDSLNAAMDLDGFLVYMASQMILGNMDWPRQNVKYWRYTGTQGEQAPLDGRWYFIMGDSDLGFGSNTPVTGDMFARVKLKNAPVSRLFMAMMRSAELRDRFVEHARRLIATSLSPERCSSVLERFVSLLEPEMDRHTARWRKPLNKAAWQAEVQVMRYYARERASVVKEQLKAFKVP